MFCKPIVLNVSCFNLPCNLSVVSSNGVYIKNITLESFNSKVCFFTKEQSFNLIARYNNQAIYKTIYLSNKRCQNICLNYAFSNSISQKAISIITLSDKNYGFLVDKAILNFKQVYSK